MLRVTVETWIKNLLYSGMTLQEGAHGERVRALTLVTQKVRAHAALNQKGRVRIERRSHGHDVLAHLRNQLAARNDCAAHHIAVARGVLRQAMQENVDVVGAVVVKTRKCIVEDGESACA